MFTNATKATLDNEARGNIPMMHSSDQTGRTAGQGKEVHGILVDHFRGDSSTVKSVDGFQRDQLDCK